MKNRLLLTLTLFCPLGLIVCHELAPNLNFHPSKPTLEKIKDVIRAKEKGVYLRLGDGELVIAKGGVNSEQRAEPGTHLQKEMQECFGLNGPNILKALPLNCNEFGGFESGMDSVGVHGWAYKDCVQFLTEAKTLWNSEVVDVYSQIALHHLVINDQDYAIDFFKFLKSSNCVLFVGNERIPAHIRNSLFGSKCHFIPTPPRDAYTNLDHIEQECLNYLSTISEYKVAVINVGVAGVILQKRLWSKLDNIFMFNVGSVIDLLCGWNPTREWIRIVKGRINVNDFLHKLS